MARFIVLFAVLAILSNTFAELAPAAQIMPASRQAVKRLKGLIGELGDTMGFIEVQAAQESPLFKNADPIRLLFIKLDNENGILAGVHNEWLMKKSKSTVRLQKKSARRIRRLNSQLDKLIPIKRVSKRMRSLLRYRTTLVKSISGIVSFL